MTVQMTGEDEKALEAMAGDAASLLREGAAGKWSVIGPGRPAVGKRRDLHYRMIYVKCPRLSLLIGLKNRLEEWAKDRTEAGFVQFEIR